MLSEGIYYDYSGYMAVFLLYSLMQKNLLVIKGSGYWGKT